MVKAMEYIVRCVNDEGLISAWLSLGVADGDIDAGDLSIKEDDLESEEATFYTEDEADFAELMDLFLSIMRDAKEEGGLYCGGVVSGRRERDE